MNDLIGRSVMFQPCCFMQKNYSRESDCEHLQPVRGVIEFVNARNGWFRIKYTAGRTVQHECFKLVDIGKDVTLLGHKKNC